MTDVNDRNFKKMNDNHLSQSTKNKVLEYIETDKVYQTKLDAFLAKHQDEILDLDNAREKRNRALDDATQSIRRDADLAPRDEAQRFIFGPFDAQKKQSEFYIPETFKAIAERTGHLQSMIDSGVIQIKTDVDFDNAKKYLEKNKLEKTFASAYDTKPQTTAVSRAGDIPAFGIPVKDATAKK